MKGRDAEELLTAWADDPRSLSAEERAEVEALVERTPALRGEADDTRALLGRVRELPDEGIEPAWDDFARKVRIAVADEPRRGWLARWWKPALGLGLAVAAATIVIATRRGPADTKPDRIGQRTAPPDAAPDDRIAETPTPDGDEPFAFGAAGALSPDELDELDDDAIDEDVLDEVAAVFAEDDDDEADEDDTAAEGEAEAAPSDGLVPDLDLAWIDELDDDEIDRVDAWLALETE